MKQLFEVGKTYKTRSGDSVTIYAYYPDQDRCYHGATCQRGVWIPRHWDKEGYWDFEKKETHLDIIPKLREWDVSVSPTGNYIMSTEYDETSSWITRIKVREVLE